MKRILISTLLAVILALSFPLVSCSQAKPKLVLPDSKVIVKGTSSMHDWEVAFKEYNVEFDLRNGENGRMSFNNIKAVFSGSSVTSESSIMTGKARDALMVKDHPEIIFISDGADLDIKNGREVSGTMNGKLLIGGKTKQIAFDFSGLINGDKILISGSEEVNMPDYGIKPPTALMGALKTGEKVTVNLQLSFLIPSANIGSN